MPAPHQSSLLLLVSCLGCILGCAGLGVGEVQMTPQDKLVPFTARELAQTHDTPVDLSRETMTMEREFGGSYTITYTFDHSDADPVLVINNLLTRENTAGDAYTTYGVLKSVIALQFMSEGIEQQDRPELCTLGSTCDCDGLFHAGAEIGTQCFLLDGHSVAMVHMIGAAWTEPLEVDAALGPMLARLTSWQPTQQPE